MDREVRLWVICTEMNEGHPKHIHNLTVTLPSLATLTPPPHISSMLKASSYFTEGKNKGKEEKSAGQA